LEADALFEQRRESIDCASRIHEIESTMDFRFRGNDGKEGGNTVDVVQDMSTASLAARA
jgi:hypothetical protein